MVRTRIRTEYVPIMAGKNKITVGTKVDREYYERLKERAEREGKSLGELVRENLNLLDFSDRLTNIIFMYDLTYENLISGIEYLLKTGQIVVKDGQMQTGENKIEEWKKMVEKTE